MRTSSVKLDERSKCVTPVYIHTCVIRRRYSVRYVKRTRERARGYYYSELSRVKLPALREHERNYRSRKHFAPN